MIRKRIAGMLASTALVLAGGAALAPGAAASGPSLSTAPPASAASVQQACWGQPEHGSEGHYGNSGWCDSGRYRQAIRCENLGGYRYVHYGPYVWAPAKSTAWCSLGDRVVGTWLE
ncbi:hypothetical protein ACF058_05900 [Streptomyces sp. NPDC015501]|uniref:hypothetical protein n=1 Tax=unclassified Streptomyces TaxID=2593676 RepID=UPI00119EF638|nr:hypothetical protein A3L22_05860 [Streptomyces griseus subsp. griseus]WSS54883.1 hypothetical protein OG543_05590 [Streptomyces sp. NBC_01178]